MRDKTICITLIKFAKNFYEVYDISMEKGLYEP